jgi:cytochrome P450
LRLLRERPFDFFTALADQYGELVEVRLGDRLFYVVNEPDLIRDILVTRGASFEKFPRIARTQGLFGDGLLTSEEPVHLRQRRLVQPAFHRDRILGYGRTMVAAAQELVSSWRDGAEVDVPAAMNHLALDIVCRTMFGVDSRAESRAVGEALETVLRMLNHLVMPWGSLLMALPFPSTRRYQAALRELDEIVYRMIRERRRTGEDRGDLLSMLLAAQENGVGMDDLQLRDEVMTIFVAGHETVANGLAWAWYLLGRHADATARLERELNEVVGARAPEPEDYPRLTYTEQVWSESMRLYPPVWILGRRALEPYTFSGGSAAPGAVFLVCMQALHRREALWTDPQAFRPERWEGGIRHRFGYLPFGAGSRLCIGERYAWMEGVLVLATIAQQWRLHALDDAAPQGLLTLRPRTGFRMRLVAR